MKYLIKLLCVLILLSLTLTGCKYNDEDIIDNNAQKQTCPYADYDYSMKPYFAKAASAGHYTTVYQNYAFGVNLAAMLSYVDLSDLKREMRSYKRSQEEYDHNGFLGQTHIKVCNEEHENPYDCPAYLYGSYLFILDAYESAGSYPVFYITRQRNGSNTGAPYYLYRYSLLNNTREELFKLKGEPSGMMIYGDYIYVSELYGTGDYTIEVINKKTKTATSASIGKKRIEPIHADGDKVYFYEWLTGTLYVSDRELTEYKPIFTPPELFTVRVTERDIGMFINGGYIYFRDNYEERPVPMPRTEPVQYITPFVYNIRRVPLDNPEAESEIVARDVFEECDHGIYGNYFYFTPFDPQEQKNAYCYYNFNNGRLCRTDLTTLKTEDLISDSGLFFEGENDVYICDRYIICNMRPATEKGLFVTMGDACCYRMIYNFKTNEVYYVDDAEGSGFIVKPMPG